MDMMALIGGGKVNVEIKDVCSNSEDPTMSDSTNLEKLEGLVCSSSLDDDDVKGAAPANRKLLTGAIFSKTYKNCNQLAKFYSVTLLKLTQFLLRNKEVLEISKY
jgi:hypothetical protein